jgi:hypothetical protein
MELSSLCFCTCLCKSNFPSPGKDAERCFFLFSPCLYFLCYPVMELKPQFWITVKLRYKDDILGKFPARLVRGIFCFMEFAQFCSTVQLII